MATNLSVETQVAETVIPAIATRNGGAFWRRVGLVGGLVAVSVAVLYAQYFLLWT